MTYSVETKPKIDTDNENEQVNQDWQPIEDYKTWNGAENRAKKESRKKAVYEAHAYYYDPVDDINFSAYYRNGKLEWQMSG